MTREEAIEILEDGAWWGIVDILLCDSDAGKALHDALDVAVSALRAQQEPNAPLTLEELREMGGEPVWITPGGFWALVIASPGERVRLICNDGERVFADKEIELVGPIYRRRPEEGAK